MMLVEIFDPQVEKYGPDPAGRHRESTENGSKILVNGFGEWISPVPPGTDRSLPKPAPGYGHRVSWVEFLAFSDRFRPETVRFLRVFCGNSRNTASGIIDLGLFNMDGSKPTEVFIYLIRVYPSLSFASLE